MMKKTKATTTYTRFFLYKYEVHKHAQPQIERILSTSLSTAPASDLVVDIKIYQNLQFLHEVFPKSQKNNTQMIFSL